MEDGERTDPVTTASGSGDTYSVRDGVVAGLLGGAAVVLFFFLMDVLQGDAFRTPAFLAETILGAADPAGPGAVAAFTVLHFTAFSALGVGAVLLTRWCEIPQNLLVGAVYGLFVGTLLFYLSLALTGTSVLPAPWWPSVMVGNLAAGLVMGTYLHWISPRPGPFGIVNELEKHPTVREGLLAGLLGALTVAAWFLVVDLVSGQALYTPGALGSALFLSASGPGQVEVSAATVLGYTALHFAAFFTFGIALAGLVRQVERFPPLIFLLIILAVVFELFVVALVAILGQWILRELAWWSVLVGNLLAALAMGGYLWQVHPKLREQLRTNAGWLE